MERLHVDVVVIGAGPAGLVLTETLARRGLSVALVERQSDPARSPQGALLQPVTLDLLHRLVAFEHSAEQEGAITAIEEYGPEGRIFARAFAGLPGAPVTHALNITQGRLRARLLSHVEKWPSVTVMTGTEVSRLQRTNVGGCHTIVAAVEQPGSPTGLESRWVVAADGKHSQTRGLAGIEARFEGGDHSLWLLPVPTPAEYPKVIRAHRRPDGMATTVPGASPGHTYIFTHLADRGAAPHQIVEWATEVVRETDPALGDALRSQATPNRILPIEPQIVSTSAWRRGGVLLLGDSAHGMYNIGGQGLNTSIQDALLVSDAIGGPGESDAVERLDEFVRIRRPFIDEFQAAQQKLGSGFWPLGGGTSWFEARFEELSLGQAELRSRWSSAIDVLSQ